LAIKLDLVHYNRKPHSILDHLWLKGRVWEEAGGGIWPTQKFCRGTPYGQCECD